MVVAITLSGAEFRRRFRWLIFHTWSIPPVFGLEFILPIGVLTSAQVLGVLTTPPGLVYILGWLAFAVWFLPRAMRPLADWLDAKPGSSPERAVRAVRRFPLIFRATFLLYLAIAPASVIRSAKLYTGFVATPYDWFRIELVALIVSIIVGLPIFFLIFDLFGQALGALGMLIDGLLQLSRVGRAALNTTAVDLSAMARESPYMATRGSCTRYSSTCSTVPGSTPPRPSRRESNSGSDRSTGRCVLRA